MHGWNFDTTTPTPQPPTPTTPTMPTHTTPLQSLFLLTGPNMAGKSTLLRTLCAVCLLGACGLAAPARSASVPYLDAFMLRNFSADSPVDGRSSFAVEMTEMRCAD